MKRFLIFAVLIFATIAPVVVAQIPGLLPAGTVWGNRGATSALPAATRTPVLGLPGTAAGSLGIANGGASGKTITIQNRSGTADYNFNLPATAGTSGQVMRSAGGGASDSTWQTPGTIWTQDANNVAITGGAITGLSSPTISADAATKGYVDATSSGLTIQTNVRLATAAVLPNSPTYANGASGVGATLTAGSNAALTVDGTAAAAGNRILVKDQASQLQNGVYSVTTVGDGSTPWVITRVTDFDTAAEMLKGSYFLVTAGVANPNSSYVLQNTVTTVGTTAAVFVQFAGTSAASVNAGGGGIVPSTGNPATLYIEQMQPMGRLTLVSPNGCDINTDQTAQTTIYYAPCGGRWVPIYDGTDMKLRAFTANSADATGLSVALGTNWAANTLYDWFAGLNTGTVTLCSGPAWTSSAAGTSSRGTGAGTTQLAMFNGLMTNAVSMTCRYANGSTFTCAVSQCTYLGTAVTAAQGQIDLGFGTAAPSGVVVKLSICNMYNRQDFRVFSSDTTTTWATNTGVWRAANQGSTQIRIVSCLGDVNVDAAYTNVIQTVGSYGQIGIGLNSSTTLANLSPVLFTQSASSYTTLTVNYKEVMPLGLNIIYAIEQAAATSTVFNGGVNMMVLNASGAM